MAHERCQAPDRGRGARRGAALRDAIPLAEEAVRRHAPSSAAAIELRGTLGFRLAAEMESSRDDPDRPGRAEADLRAALDQDSTRGPGRGPP